MVLIRSSMWLKMSRKRKSFTATATVNWWPSDRKLKALSQQKFHESFISVLAAFPLIINKKAFCTSWTFFWSIPEYSILLRLDSCNGTSSIPIVLHRIAMKDWLNWPDQNIDQSGLRSTWMECHYIVIELPVYADTERWIRAPVHTTKLNGGAFRLPSLKAPVTRITTTAEWPGAQVSESGAEVDLRCRLDTVASSCLYCAAVHFSPLTHFQWLSDSLGYLLPIDRVFDWLLSEALQPH